MKKGIKRVLAAAFAVALTMPLGTALAQEQLGQNEYLGENAHGAGGAIRVVVTMDAETIQSIKTIEQHETRGLGTNAILQLTQDIVAANDIDVDDVSGATLSSIAFKAAVRQAVQTATQVDPTADVQLAENEYLGISENALGGRLMVKVTLAEGAIVAIDVLESHESPEIGDVTLNTLIAAMLEGNTASVDSITGATVTSLALCEAVGQALEAAQQ